MLTEREKKIKRLKQKWALREKEAKQKLERLTLTKDNAKKRKTAEKGSKSGRRIPKLAPGHKVLRSFNQSSKKLKSPKARAAIHLRQRREVAFREAERMFIQRPETRMGIDVFLAWLKERLYDDDIDKQNWFDWMEAEVSMFRSHLDSKFLIPREEDS